ncbi:MAG: LamG-like jellyroll fold domain-containing protein [Myxococcota bacterium]
MRWTSFCHARAVLSQRWLPSFLLSFLLCGGLASEAHAATSYAAEVLADNPVSYWRLGESSGTVATDQKGLNDGTYVGAVTKGVTGALIGDTDTAISFSGSTSDYVRFNAFKSHPSTAATFEFWMKSLDKSKNGTPYSYLTSTTTNTNDYLIYDYQNLALYVNGSAITSGQVLTDGNWHHVVVTWNSSDGAARVYVDGVVKLQSTIAKGAVIAGGGVAMLGQEQDCAGGCFEASQAFIGVIDEVALYNVVLTPERVLAHFQIARNDTDGDGITDPRDNCVSTANPTQSNNDGDSQGDACDSDDDNDTVADTSDNCPLTANTSQTNTDGDS